MCIPKRWCISFLFNVYDYLDFDAILVFIFWSYPYPHGTSNYNHSLYPCNINGQIYKPQIKIKEKLWH